MSFEGIMKFVSTVATRAAGFISWSWKNDLRYRVCFWHILDEKRATMKLIISVLKDRLLKTIIIAMLYVLLFACMSTSDSKGIWSIVLAIYSYFVFTNALMDEYMARFKLSSLENKLDTVQAENDKMTSKLDRLSAKKVKKSVKKTRKSRK